MSPRRRVLETSEPAKAAQRRLWLNFGVQVREARRARGWSVPELARRAGLSPTSVYVIEAGDAGSGDAAARLAVALGRRAELYLVDPRRTGDRPSLSADPVHSAMGEVEAAHLRAVGFRVGIDEPYQHYQYAGRADIVAWDVETQALLHVENRTRFPDFQEMAGSFNAKRAYLADDLGSRLGISRWMSQTHVIAALWSSEVLHALRMRTASFRALCPDSAEAFSAWWEGDPPKAGSFSTLIVLDPTAAGKQRLLVGLDEALIARPRHHGYADAAARLSSPAG